MSVFERDSSKNCENSFLRYLSSGGGGFYYHCELCGNGKNYIRKYSPSELPLSCGCIIGILPKKDYTGQEVNGIFIKGYIGKSIWRVINSCGCEQDCTMASVRQRSEFRCVKCRDSNKRLVHGHARKGKGGHSKEYQSWCNLRRRCDNKENNRYEYYGDLGITYPSEWESFEVFLADMGLCPEGYSIERLDTKEGYSKDNCVWASDKTQANNKSNNILISNGEDCMSLKHWCDSLNIDYKQAHYRLRRKGLNVEDILGVGYRLARDKFDI